MRTAPLPRTRARRVDAGAAGGRGGRGPHGGGQGWEAESRRRADTARVGLWLALAAVTMLFVGFTSTYLVRRGQPDWQVGPLPWLFWVNTAVLLGSSLTVERARRAARAGAVDRALRGLGWTVGLSLAFVAGQVMAWRQLAAAGIFMASSPHAAFVYLLSGVHALHVAGGVAVLLHALRRARREARRGGEQAQAGVAVVADLAATYWHFVDGLWLYLFALLYAL